MVLTLLQQAGPDDNSEAHPMHSRRFNFPSPLRYARQVLQSVEQHCSTITGLEKGTAKWEKMLLCILNFKASFCSQLPGCSLFVGIPNVSHDP
jgi:hypothetical protein